MSNEYQKFINSCLKINEAINTLGYFVAKYGLPGNRILKDMRKSSNSKIYKIKVDDLKAREDWGVLGFTTNLGNKYAICWNPAYGWEVYGNGKPTYKHLKNWKACRDWIANIAASEKGIENNEAEVLDRDPQFDNVRNMNRIGENPQSPKAVINKANKDIETTARVISYNLDDILHKARRDGVEPKDAVYIMLESIKPINSIYKILRDNDSYLVNMLKTEQEWRWEDKIENILLDNWSKIPDADIRKFHNINIKVNPALMKRLNTYKRETGEKTSLKVYDDIAAALSPYIDMANYQKYRARLLDKRDYVGSSLFKLDTSKFKTINDLINFYKVIAANFPNIELTDANSIWIEQDVSSNSIELLFHNLPQALNLHFDNNTGKMIKGTIR